MVRYCDDLATHLRTKARTAAEEEGVRKPPADGADAAEVGPAEPPPSQGDAPEPPGPAAASAEQHPETTPPPRPAQEAPAPTPGPGTQHPLRNLPRSSATSRPQTAAGGRGATERAMYELAARAHQLQLLEGGAERRAFGIKGTPRPLTTPSATTPRPASSRISHKSYNVLTHEWTERSY